MTKKIVIGGILAGVMMFVWSSIAHVGLPIGEMGISTISNEDAVLAAMKTSMPASGLYFLPGNDYMQAPREQRGAAMKAMMEKQKTTGWAMVVYHPNGGEDISPKTLGLQFLTAVVAGLIFAFALWAALARVVSFGGRVMFVTALGLLPFIVSDFPKWNWYGYPTMFELGQILDYGVGGLLAGIVLAWYFRREATA
ncbi:MAG: hypothetical protein JWN45_583 [Acidobacteriaceae bacterium]|nr:hypothetical protein [Acidobacteriaceae bacterium]